MLHLSPGLPCRLGNLLQSTLLGLCWTGQQIQAFVLGPCMSQGYLGVCFAQSPLQAKPRYTPEFPRAYCDPVPRLRISCPRQPRKRSEVLHQCSCLSPVWNDLPFPCSPRTFRLSLCLLFLLVLAAWHASQRRKSLDGPDQKIMPRVWQYSFPRKNCKPPKQNWRSLRMLVQTYCLQQLRYGNPSDWDALRVPLRALVEANRHACRQK